MKVLPNKTETISFTVQAGLLDVCWWGRAWKEQIREEGRTWIYVSVPFWSSKLLPSSEVWHNQVVSLWNCCSPQPMSEPIRALRRSARYCVSRGVTAVCGSGLLRGPAAPQAPCRTVTIVAPGRMP